MTKNKNHMIRIQDEELFTKAKIFGATHGLSLIEITEAALNQYLKKFIIKIPKKSC